MVRPLALRPNDERFLGKPTEEYWTWYARNQVLNTYGDQVSVVEKAKPLSKFGRNPAIIAGARHTLWEIGGNETYPVANTIDSVSSSNAGDTQLVVIEGHTIDGNGDFTFAVQSATLQGQTRVPLTTPLARSTRIYNAGATQLLGTVYVYENTALSGGVPVDLTKAHVSMGAATNQSSKMATTISKDDYWFVDSIYFSVTEKTAAYADFQVEVRLKGGVFRNLFHGTASSQSGTSFYKFMPYLIVPPNSDVRMTAVGSGTVEAEGGMDGVLALIMP